MKTFELTGRMVFAAEDLEDAFRRLRDHFEALANDEDSNLLEPGSNVEVRPTFSFPRDET